MAEQITEQELSYLKFYAGNRSGFEIATLIDRISAVYLAQREEIASLNSTCASYEAQSVCNATEIAMLRTRGATEWMDAPMGPVQSSPDLEKFRLALEDIASGDSSSTLAGAIAIAKKALDSGGGTVSQEQQPALNDVYERITVLEHGLRDLRQRIEGGG